VGPTLEPGQVVAHYRVIGPIGAGGMGEVYLAHDLTLERNVALKVLPADLVSNEQRLRRFVLEAKSASSLNHPNIITIYEIGHASVQSGNATAPGPGDGPSVHFIAMEYIDGDTLGEKIYRDKTDPRTLLGYLTQAAEGLAKAHAAGIVHRDLKPGNIMVTRDGFTKVLDFGLAKLTDRGSDPGSETRTAAVEDLTGSGGIVGTAAYMSPEQVAGKAIDARSDIFSFGCMLYEAAARKRPFAAETGVETMNKILNEKPAPLDEISPAVPADVRKLVRRCLAKSPDQRYQSIKDVAIELREMVDEYESLPRSGSSGGSVSSAMVQAPARRWSVLQMAGIAAALLVVAGTAAAWLFVWRGGAAKPKADDALQTLRITSVVSGRDIRDPSISPDGRYLAYVRTVGDQFTLVVRQISSGSNVTIIAGQGPNISRLRFAPDGDYLYYLSTDEASPGYSALFVIPSLGGAPRKIVDDVDSRITFAPDGKRVAFVRNVIRTHDSQILIFDLAARTQRMVAIVNPPEAVNPRVGLHWSRDGRTLTTLLASTAGSGGDYRMATFDVDTGRRENVAQWGHLAVFSGAWLMGGRLFVGGSDPSMFLAQLLELSPGSARGRRITNDDSNYDSPSASADGTTLAALRVSPSLTLWTASISGQGQPRQLPIGINNPLLPRTTRDGTILFRRFGGERLAIWRAEPDGSTPRQVSPDTLDIAGYRPIPGTNALVFTGIGDDMVSHLWRMDHDGSSLVQLTRGPGETLLDISTDGKFLLALQAQGVSHQLMRFSIGPGAGAVPVGRAGRDDASFSPDGALVLQAQYGVVNERDVPMATFYPSGGGASVGTLELTGRMRGSEWWTDATALTYVTEENGVDTMMRLPIVGGVPTPVFRFPSGRILGTSWSPDRRTMLIAASAGQATNFWAWSLGSAEPRQITHFPSGVLNSAGWSPDGSAIYFTQGNPTRDIVLIRGFK